MQTDRICQTMALSRHEQESNKQSQDACLGGQKLSAGQRTVKERLVMRRILDEH